MSDKSIEIVEIFGEEGNFAIQGEGQLAGVPAIFIRTFGCNLSCKFGIHPSQYDIWERQVRGYANEFNTLESLPVRSTGCDTYYSIFPEFRKFTTAYSVDELVAEINRRCGNFGENVHLVITGGEPLLPANQEFFAEFINKAAVDCNIHHVTFETNTTQNLSFDFYDAKLYPSIYFSMSPKLSCSGHSFVDTCCPDVIREYIDYTDGRSDSSAAWFKFVINDESNILEIEHFLDACGLDKREVAVYLMPEGGTKAQFLTNEKKVYEICAKYGYRYSPRHQVTIMDNGVGI